MDGFREGFEFFAEHASDFAGMDLGSGYVDSVNGEISEFIESILFAYADVIVCISLRPPFSFVFCSDISLMHDKCFVIVPTV